ncbi:MAG: acyl carrier protein [Fibrobacteres bacterium]|jgi:acyl carrier protein|nr:acyl carrier protein [Fibrobacterota bacterium]
MGNPPTREAFKNSMARFLKRKPESLDENALLLELVQESFLLVEMIIELQEQFPIRLSQEDLRAVRTVGDLLRMLIAKTV